MTQHALSRPEHAAATAISLNGTWDFRFVGKTMDHAATEHRIVVPGIWQTQFADLRNTSGVGIYRRDVVVPEAFAGKRLFLVFEGIFHHAIVRVDGNDLARHANAWVPFEIELAGTIRQFSLEVEVHVPDDSDYAEGGFGELLHGKQDWYGLHGGIWKGVRLEARSDVHLTDLRVRTQTDLVTHTIQIGGGLSEGESAELALRVTREGAVIAEDRLSVGKDFSVELTVPQVELWSPDSPNLYELTLSLGCDKTVRTIGFRRFESRDGRLFLNGEPFYLMGALDHDWHADGECGTRHPHGRETRLRNAKALGLNALRCHVKIPDAEYFELADRLGLIVWLDMPYAEFLSPRTRDQLVETFESAVDTHGSHPSICIWTLMNEGWGIELDDNPDDRSWLIETYDRAKPQVAGDLVVDNSACFPRNYHLVSDIEDFHWYQAFLSGNDRFQAITDQFAARPDWSYSPHGDTRRSGNEPLICSEFGVWGLPYPDELLEEDGSEPWWFENGHDWNQGAAYPHGIATRFRDAGLASIFGNVAGFAKAAQQAQFRGLKHQIETLRLAEPLSGYVITELNDTHWEANGLMDAHNTVRDFGSELADLQTPWLVVGRTDRTTRQSGEPFSVRVRLTGAAPSPEDAVVSWRFGGACGHAKLMPSRAGSTEISLDLIAPEATAIACLPLELEVHDASGRRLSRNNVEICVIPFLTSMPSLAVLDEGAARVLSGLGIAEAKDAGTLVATRLTGAVRSALLSGRKVLLIANEPNALTDPERQLPKSDLFNFPKMQIAERDGTLWDGSWMGAFAWHRTDGPWAGFANGPMLDQHWVGLIPRYVLTGFRNTAFSGLVDAGMAVAWLHKSAAFSKRSFLGKEWMTVTTFDLTSATALDNPLAPYLLAALASS